MTKAEISESCRYFWCHAGRTELAHYKHALSALQLLDLLDKASLLDASERYYNKLMQAFNALAKI